jgi:hypothetical protein
VLTFDDIANEFKESLGYIRQDIRWLCKHNSGLNYTVALLVGCACEALSDGGAYPSKERALAELFPDEDWKKLAKPLFDAIRNGLAHSFDTKHIHVNGQVVQIVFAWGPAPLVRIGPFAGQGDGLYVGTILLGKSVCALIDQFEATLRNDPAACQRFKNALQRDRKVNCSQHLWTVLKHKS